MELRDATRLARNWMKWASNLPSHAVANSREEKSLAKLLLKVSAKTNERFGDSWDILEQ